MSKATSIGPVKRKKKLASRPLASSSSRSAKKVRLPGVVQITKTLTLLGAQAGVDARTRPFVGGTNQ